MTIYLYYHSGLVAERNVIPVNDHRMISCILIVAVYCCDQLTSSLLVASVVERGQCDSGNAYAHLSELMCGLELTVH